MTVEEFDIALTELETRVDRLRALYENWFRGYEKSEPSVPRKDAERRVYALRKELPRNTALRFRYHQLYLKYTTLANYWQRTARQIEEGTYKPQLQRLKRKHDQEQKERDRRDRRRLERGEGEEQQEGPRGYELDLDESLNVDDLLDELEMEEVAKAIEQPGPHSEPPPPTKTHARPTAGVAIPGAPAVATFSKSKQTAQSPSAARPVAQVAAVGSRPGAAVPDRPAMPQPELTAPASGAGQPQRPAAAPAGGAAVPGAPAPRSGLNPPGATMSRPSPAQPAGARPAPASSGTGVLPPPAPGTGTTSMPRTQPGTGAAAGALPPAAPGTGTTAMPRTQPGTGAAGPSSGTLPRPPAPAAPAVRPPASGPQTRPAPTAPGIGIPGAPQAGIPAAPKVAPVITTSSPNGAGNPSPPTRPAPPLRAPASATSAAPAPRPAAPASVGGGPRSAPVAPSGTTIGRPAPASAQRAPIQGGGTFVGRPPTASPLAGGGAPDEGRLKRIYEEYSAARRRNNEGDVRYEALVGSIQKMLPELSKKHQGKSIDFEVVVKDGRVGLKPKAT